MNYYCETFGWCLDYIENGFYSGIASIPVPNGQELMSNGLVYDIAGEWQYDDESIINDENRLKMAEDPLRTNSMFDKPRVRGIPVGFVEE